MNVTHEFLSVAARSSCETALLTRVRPISFSMIEHAILRWEALFDSRGLQAGERVALHLPNHPAFVAAWFAIVKRGAVVVSIGPMLQPDEIRHMLADAQCAGWISDSPADPKLDLDSLSSLRWIARCDTRGLDPCPDVRFELMGSRRTLNADPCPENVASFLYTSGTTGRPKAVMLTHANILFNAEAVRTHTPMAPGKGAALFLPLFHVFGQNFLMNAGLLAGATLRLFPRFEVEAVLRAAAQGEIRYLAGVPRVFAKLLEAGVTKDSFQGLEYAFSAAAPLPASIEEQWFDRVGVPIRQGYGLTETSPFAAWTGDCTSAPGLIGRAVIRTQIRVLDDSGTPVAPGVSGEIGIHGPGVMKGYWRRETETQEAIRDGFLRSGDIGFEGTDGSFFLTDRKKEMINRSGFKVWPSEVERVLQMHPDVREAAVVGRPDQEFGERVVAFIIPNLSSGCNPSTHDFLDYCRQHLASYKVPSEVRLLEEFPRTASGKTAKRLLPVV